MIVLVRLQSVVNNTELQFVLYLVVILASAVENQVAVFTPDFAIRTVLLKMSFNVLFLKSKQRITSERTRYIPVELTIFDVLNHLFIANGFHFA